MAVTVTRSDEERGADAGGAYLTWMTAILSSVFNESVLMTLSATGILVNAQTWYPNLRRYLSPTAPPGPLFSDVMSTEENAVNEDNQIDERSFKAYQSRVQATSLWQRLRGGRIDRRVLMLSALLYIVMEVCVLIVTLIQLLGSLSSPEPTEIFVPPEEAGQFGIHGCDALGMFNARDHLFRNEKWDGRKLTILFLRKFTPLSQLFQCSSELFLFNSGTW